MDRQRIVGGPSEPDLRSAMETGGPLTFTLEGGREITLDRTSIIHDGGGYGWELMGHIGAGKMHYEVPSYNPKTGRGFLTEEPHD